jgi:tRNA 2-thiouridine synthesizing protein A
MSRQLDARGLSCPQPVLLVKRALEESRQGNLEVLVDSATSRENVSRLARNLGWSVTIEEKDGEFRLVLKR